MSGFSVSIFLVKPRDKELEGGGGGDGNFAELESYS